MSDIALNQLNIDNILNECKEIFLYFDLKFPNIIEIKLTDSVSYWGEIYRYKDKNKKYFYSLFISKAFEYIDDDKINILKHLKNTIMHELIHTIKGCWNHKYNFSLWRDRILKHFPCIDILEDKSKYNGAFKKLKSPKYIIRCLKCGQEFYIYRKLKYKLNDYVCTKCGNESLEYM